MLPMMGKVSLYDDVGDDDDYTMVKCCGIYDVRDGGLCGVGFLIGECGLQTSIVRMIYNIIVIIIITVKWNENGERL